MYRPSLYKKPNQANQSNIVIVWHIKRQIMILITSEQTFVRIRLYELLQGSYFQENNFLDKITFVRSFDIQSVQKKEKNTLEAVLILNKMSTSDIKWCVVLGLYFFSSLGSRMPKVKYAGRYDIRQNVLNFHEFEITFLNPIINNVLSRAFQTPKIIHTFHIYC